MKYAGIGSRETPKDIMELMYQFAKTAAQKGWLLRSGHADGADVSFEWGCDAAQGKKEIFLPWQYFNGSMSHLHVISDAAMEMAAKFHPAWSKCSNAAKRLHARNCYQILGNNLTDPVHMVVCWTKDGLGGGGTGQALRIARSYKIPVYDMGTKEGLRTIVDSITG